MFERFRTIVKSSCKSNLTARIIAVEICIFLLFGIISLVRSNSSFQKNARNFLNGITIETTEIVNQFVEEKGHILKQIAENPQLKAYISESASIQAAKESRYYEFVTSMLSTTVLSENGISYCWIASDGNGVITSSDKEVSMFPLSITGAAWYPAIVSSQTPNYIWCSPNLSNGISGNSSISVVTEIEENGNILGYAGIEIFEEQLCCFLDGLEFPNGVYPMVLSKNGSTLYKSKKANFADTFNLYHSSVITALDAARYSDSGTESLSSDHIRQHLQYQTNSSGWKILIFFDTKTAMGVPAMFFYQEVVILVCFMALLLILSSSLIRSAFRGLPQLLKNAGSVCSGNYNIKLNCKRQDEFGVLANAVDHLSGKIDEKNKTIEQYAYFDLLTGLPNRSGIYNQLKNMILEANNEGTRLAVIFFNISNFKWINDTMGHNYGDAYLKAFSEKLKTIAESYGFLGRFSGDCFALLTPLANTPEEILDIVNKIKAHFQNTITVYQDPLYVKFSVGISVFPDDDFTSDLLLRDADVALNNSKKNGFGKPEFYNNSVHHQITNRAKIGQKLGKALSEHEMSLYFQPIIHTDSRGIYGFEVLLRWNNRELGEISPEIFIPMAEETGSIIPIGTWALESACRFHKTLCQRFGQDFIMSINVSPQQILQPGFAENIQQVLDITQLRPELVQLEITETVLIELFDFAEGIFLKLRNMGIKIALDDFGTGYSSLSYLKSFPIQCLKIDRSFVTDIFEDNRDYAITHSIIEMVHQLGIKTVAEGVETEGQFSSLKKMNCDYIQGYMVGKALTEQQTLEFIENYNKLHELD